MSDKINRLKLRSGVSRGLSPTVLRQFFFTIIFVIAMSGASAMGEKYAEQGSRLTKMLRTALIDQGFCTTPQECQKLLPGTAGHGDRVRVVYYEVNEKNKNALVFLMTLVAQRGLLVTDGVPITMTAYRESHEEYRKAGFLSQIEPALLLEVNK